MKKFLSVLIAVLLLLSLCVSGICADLKQPVGTHGGGNGIADGVGDIPSNAGATGDVVLTIGLNNRYAVDVEFPDMIVTAGSATWDVNALEYRLDDGTLPSNKSFIITVINYSDMPVQATPSAIMTADGQTAAVSLSVPQEPVTLMAVTDSTNISKGPVEKTITAELTSLNWNASIGNLIAAGKKGNVTVGTITISIAKG